MLSSACILDSYTTQLSSCTCLIVLSLDRIDCQFVRIPEGVPIITGAIPPCFAFSLCDQYEGGVVVQEAGRAGKAPGAQEDNKKKAVECAREFKRTRRRRNHARRQKLPSGML
eukprot:g15101.t1